MKSGEVICRCWRNAPTLEEAREYRRKLANRGNGTVKYIVIHESSVSMLMERVARRQEETYPHSEIVKVQERLRLLREKTSSGKKCVQDAAVFAKTGKWVR
jgi:hypothetical protein